VKRTSSFEIAACAALAFAVVACRRSAPPPEPAPALGPDEDPPTLAGAVEKARQWAGSDVNATTARSLVLVGWANRHLTWSDVNVANNETSYAQIAKDAGSQIGKRMCVSGKVARLNLVRTDQAQSSAGVLLSDAGEPFAFMAAHNMGSVTEMQAARLCGIVTGWNAAESDIGPARAAVMVGMFEVDRDNVRD
jgi:hypothetical protein